VEWRIRETEELGPGNLYIAALKIVLGGSAPGSGSAHVQTGSDGDFGGGNKVKGTFTL
jgi:hypothetical protein